MYNPVPLAACTNDKGMYVCMYVLRWLQSDKVLIPISGGSRCVCLSGPTVIDDVPYSTSMSLLWLQAHVARKQQQHHISRLKSLPSLVVMTGGVLLLVGVYLFVVRYLSTTRITMCAGEGNRRKAL